MEHNGKQNLYYLASGRTAHLMSSLLMKLTLLLCLIISTTGLGFAQQAPETSSKPWKIQDQVLLQTQITLSHQDNSEIETTKAYGLAELINIAEERNPQTQAAWEKAKEAAARLGVVRSELFPTLAVVAPLVNDSTALFSWDLLSTEPLPFSSGG